MSALTQPQILLQQFWDLATVDESARVVAASKLTELLSSAQKKHAGNDQDTWTELDYSLRRLVRGLTSNREGARQGFSLALTEVLAKFQVVQVPHTLAQIWQHTESHAKMKGWEQRDAMYGRIFGLAAVFRSGRLSEAENLGQWAKELVDIAEHKPYAAEIAYSILADMTLELPETIVSECIIPLLDSPLRASLDSFSPELLDLVIRVQGKKTEDVTSPFWAHGQILSLGNLSKLITPLRQSTRAHPRVHAVWTTILASISDSSSILTHFWKIIVDDGLFTSSLERKYLGFRLFGLIISRLSAQDLPLIFSHNFMRCFINHLSNKTNALHNATKGVLRSIMSATEKDVNVRVGIVSQLIGENGAREFDKLTKTTIVHDLLSSLDSKGAGSYATFLFDMYYSAVKESDDIKVVEARQVWVGSALLTLVKNKSIPKSVEWISDVLLFMVTQACFQIGNRSVGAEIGARIWPSHPTETKGKKRKKTSISIPSPISTRVSQLFSDKLISVLSILSTLDSTLQAPTTATHLLGTLESGQTWGQMALEQIASLKDCGLVLTNNVEIDPVLKAVSTLTLAPIEKNAVTLLLLHLCLRSVFNGDELHVKMMDVIGDVSEGEVLGDAFMLFLLDVMVLYTHLHTHLHTQHQYGSSTATRALVLRVFKAFVRRWSSASLDVLLSRVKGEEEGGEESEDESEEESEEEEEEESEEEDEEESDDDTASTASPPPADDEEMERMDQFLGAMVRQAREERGLKKRTAGETLTPSDMLAVRALDMVDALIAVYPSMPISTPISTLISTPISTLIASVWLFSAIKPLLSLSLNKHDSSTPVSTPIPTLINRIRSTLHRLTHAKDYFKSTPTSTPTSTLISALEYSAELLSTGAVSGDAGAVSVCSDTMLYTLRVLVGNEQGDKALGVCEEIVKIRGGLVLNTHGDNLNVVINDIIHRQPSFAWSLIPTLISVSSSGKKPFVRGEAWSFIEKLTHQRVSPDIISPFSNMMIQAATNTVTACVEGGDMKVVNKLIRTVMLSLKHMIGQNVTCEEVTCDAFFDACMSLFASHAFNDQLVSLTSKVLTQLNLNARDFEAVVQEKFGKKKKRVREEGVTVPPPVPPPKKKHKVVRDEQGVIIAIETEGGKRVSKRPREQKKSHVKESVTIVPRGNVRLSKEEKTAKRKAVLANKRAKSERRRKLVESRKKEQNTSKKPRRTKAEKEKMRKDAKKSESE